MKTIFIVDPYFADSHRYWAEGLAKSFSHNVRVFSLPPVHWKWRMEASAIALAKTIQDIKEIPDIFLVTDFLNLALFKSLLGRKYNYVKFVLYMHENQLTYPISSKDTDRLHSRDNHYGFMNYTSALVAERVVFNSEYHRNSFFQELYILSNKLPEQLNIEDVESKSSVIPLQLNFEHGEICESNNEFKTIIWNHRWEYDKRPDVFLNALLNLKKDQIPFRLILLGKMDENSRRLYGEELELLSDNIIHLGYAETKASYFQLLCRGDIIVSTAEHEFFGVSVLEGMYAGCRPVLPNDLAYPELIPRSLHSEILYEKGSFLTALKMALYQEFSEDSAKQIRNHLQSSFSWEKISALYERLFDEVRNEK